MLERFADADVDALSKDYARGFRLPGSLAAAVEEYLARSGKRERWPIQHIANCCRRIAGRPMGGSAALEAGCGSGGSLLHLAERFDEVAGQDTDLGALLIAAKRVRQARLQDRVTLVAAPLEKRVFSEGMFDLIKCTDVLEHVEDPLVVSGNLGDQLVPGGILYVLTPNRWALTKPEPHVRLWFVGYMPRHWAETYVRWRLGVSYANVAHLLSYPRLRRVLEARGHMQVHFVPVEDKHLNPDSRRGRVLKSLFRVGPLRWASALGRPVQPVLEALSIKGGS